MDGDFQSKLKNVLSDPDALAKISAIASSLGNQPNPSTPPPPDNPPTEIVNDPSYNAVSDFLPYTSDPRITLLNSVKPLLREDKRERVDALTRAITIASMMRSFRK